MHGGQVAAAVTLRFPDEIKTMHDGIISILTVEDNPGDARLVHELLGESDRAGQFRIRVVDRLVAATEALRAGGFDVVLLDLSLPDSHGLDTLSAIRAAAPGTPVVVLTGMADEEMALRAVQGGAQDYLVKGRGDGDLIRRALTYAIERNRAEEALRQSEARFRAIFEDTVIGISVVAADGSLLDANPALHAMLGYELGALREISVRDITHPEDRDGSLRPLAELLAGKTDHYALEKRYRRRSGETMWARVNVSLVRGVGQQPLFAVALIEDITDRKAAEDRLRLAAKVLENVSEGIIVTDRNHTIIQVNPAFTELTGYEPEEVIGRKPSILSSGRHDASFYQDLRAALRDGGKWQGEIWNRKKDGELFAEWLTISSVRNEADELTNFVAVFFDITLRKQTEERLSYQANHDPLTTLPNRTLFHDRLGRALARARRSGLRVAVLFLDLDRFKEVNDGCGHVVGDKLLQQVAERLAGCTREGDTVARLAGDEFTVILEDLADSRDAAAVCQKILRAMKEPFNVSDFRLNVTFSIGVSLYPADGNDIQALVKNADDAMYRAKKEGKNTYRFYSEALDAQGFPWT